MFSKRNRAGMIALLLVCCALTDSVHPSSAASRFNWERSTSVFDETPSIVFEVNSLIDADDSSIGNGKCAAINGSCTLRAAISEANAATEEVLIRLPAGTFQFPRTPTVQDAHLVTYKPLQMEGVSPQETILDGAYIPPTGQHRPVIHAFDDLRLKNLTIMNGEDFVVPYRTEMYGGVAAHESLELDHVWILNNRFGVYAVQREYFGGGYSTPIVTIRSSTIQDNTVYGIHLVGGDLFLINSTVSGNQSVGVNITGTGMIIHSTITDNHTGYVGVDDAGGIAFSPTAGYLFVSHSIIAGNTRFGLPSDCWGEIVSLGYNLIGTIDRCGIMTDSNDFIGLDPKLAPLAFNSGSIPTHALLPDSPAMEGGDPEGCGIDIDQRDLPRPSDGDQDGIAICDIGAYEEQYEYRIYLSAVSR